MQRWIIFGRIKWEKVVICNKCDSIGNYDNYVWTCPLCYKKFRNNENVVNKDLSKEKKIENENRSISKEKINSNSKVFRKQKTSIKSVLFKNLRNFNNNNKENINCNINVINNKSEKVENNSLNNNNKNNKSGILKTIEKSSSGLSIHSRLFTEIDNNQIINIIERDEKSNFTNKKTRNIISSRLINFTGNKRDSKMVNNIPKCNFNISRIGKVDSSRESIEIKNLNNIFQQSIEKSMEKDGKLSNLDGMNIIKKIHKAVSSSDVRKKILGIVYIQILLKIIEIIIE